MKTVLLYSGGMDSAALRFLHMPDVLLYVDLGTEYSSWERSHLPAGTIILELKDLGKLEVPGGILPGRNLILATIASCYGERILLGATKEDRVLDKSTKFCRDTGELLSYLWSPQWWTAGKTIGVEAPLKGLTKSEILAMYKENGGNLQELADNSYSCYHPEGDEPCWTCKPCVRKWMAFRFHGLNLSEKAEEFCRTQMLPDVLAGKGLRPEEDKMLRAIFNKEITG